MARADRIKAILAQKERDDNIGRLLETMSDVYTFVLEADPVKKVESHKRILAAMTQQTVECAYFIREYATNKSFSKSLSEHQEAHLIVFLFSGKRLLENILSDADDKIKQYEDKFRELKLAFQERAVLRGGITVMRILDVVKNLGKHHRLG